MKEKLRKGILILLGIGLLSYLFFGSIMDLANTKDVYTITLKEAAEVLALEHSINGIIPTGTDYYYVGLDEEDNAYLIKASKKWLRNHFDDNYQALNSNGVPIKGLVKKISDFWTERELEDRLSQLEGVRFPLGALGCLDLNYMSMAVLKLIDGVLFLAALLMGRRIFKNRDALGTGFIGAWLGILVLSLILMLFIIK